MKKHSNIIFIIIVVALIAFVVIYFIKKGVNQNNYSSVKEIDTTINLDNSDQKIDWDSYQNYDIKNNMVITQEGVYKVDEDIDGGIVINTNGNVKLILNNVHITNPNGPAIYVVSAEDVIIELSENSVNYLEDAKEYNGYDSDVNATIYSKDDLVLQGSGTLYVQANYQDGIVGKDDLKFIDGTYYINSVDDAIRGKDSVYIEDGSFEITSGGDAIKSTNDLETQRGYVYIKNAKMTINAGLDGIQAETKVVIEDGNFNIFTGSSLSAYSTDSTKGIKASDNIVIKNGEFTFNTKDDSIHSNNHVGIENGVFSITSGDDAIHADNELIIDGGTINIIKSYEGLEAGKITINNGDIKLVSSDDGINAAGGASSSDTSTNQNKQFFSNSNNSLIINGGSIYVNATGDGLDANGSISINGGSIIVDGPTNDGNGALDYDKDCLISGGTLIAVGAKGMAQGISSSSTQYGVLIYFTNTYEENTSIKIVDANNKEILSYTPTKTFSSLAFSAKELQKNETYTVLINNENYTTFTISSIATTVGNGGFGMGGNKMDMNNKRPR